MDEISAPRSVGSGRIVQKTSGPGHAPKLTSGSPVAMFDSGVGGLTVLKEVMKVLPDEEILYFGDTARVPYGGRTPNEIVRFNFEIMNFLVALGAKAVIMACGTSSAIAYPIIKEHYGVPVIPLIDLGAAAAVAASENKKVGVIATQATIDSSAYQRAIKKIDKDAKVSAAACPLFVPLIEGGFIEADETKRVASQYLKPLLKAGIDTLILGCTHYPHLIKTLREITGVSVKFIDPAREAAEEAKKILASTGMLNSRKTAAEKYKYYVTGSTAQFEDIGSRLLGRHIHSVKKVILPKGSGKPPAK